MNTVLFVTLAACAVFCIVFAQPPPGCQRPPKPEFLDNANETVRKEFFAIVKKHGVPPEQKREQVINWAKKYGLEEQAKQHEDKVHEVMSKNGPNCKPPFLPDYLKNANETVRNEFFEIARNQAVPLDQRREQVIQWAAKYGLESQAREHEEKVKAMMDKVGRKA